MSHNTYVIGISEQFPIPLCVRISMTGPKRQRNFEERTTIYKTTPVWVIVKKYKQNCDQILENPAYHAKIEIRVVIQGCFYFVW